MSEDQKNITSPTTDEAFKEAVLKFASDTETYIAAYTSALKEMEKYISTYRVIHLTNKSPQTEIALNRALDVRGSLVEFPDVLKTIVEDFGREVGTKY